MGKPHVDSAGAFGGPGGGSGGPVGGFGGSESGGKATTETTKKKATTRTTRTTESTCRTHRGFSSRQKTQRFGSSCVLHFRCTFLRLGFCFSYVFLYILLGCRGVLQQLSIGA